MTLKVQEECKEKGSAAPKFLLFMGSCRRYVSALFLLALAIIIILVIIEDNSVVMRPKREITEPSTTPVKHRKTRLPSSLRQKKTNGQPPTEQPCQPIDRVLFLKTHKTGSSTVTNILNRYGDMKNLTFAFPWKPRAYSFYWPLRFRLAYVASVGREPNILCNHARFNKAPMNWLFPKESSRYITILREPTSHFESLFNFFGLAGNFHVRNFSNPLGEFLRNASFYFEQTTKRLYWAKNPLLFELGLDKSGQTDEGTVRRYISFLHEEFDLVMIMEYFDESLVLLKRLFCWKIEDILYFKLNERQQKRKQLDISNVMKNRILKWNSGDVLLYKFFNRTLWQKIKKQGPDFYKDLKEFRKEKAKIKDKCLVKGEFLSRTYAGRLVQGYSVKKNISKELTEMCEKMIMNEIPYAQFLREKMEKKLATIDSIKGVLDLSHYKMIHVVNS